MKKETSIEYESNDDTISTKVNETKFIKKNKETSLTYFRISNNNDEVLTSVYNRSIQGETPVQNLLRRCTLPGMGCLIAYIPHQYHNYELCKACIISNAYAINYIAPEYICNEFYEIALKLNGNLIYNVPKTFLTEELCVIAVTQTSAALHWIPAEFQTPKVLLTAKVNKEI